MKGFLESSKKRFAEALETFTAVDSARVLVTMMVRWRSLRRYIKIVCQISTGKCSKKRWCLKEMK